MGQTLSLKNTGRKDYHYEEAVKTLRTKDVYKRQGGESDEGRKT